MGTIRLFLLIAVCATFSSGLATAQHFEPLADTLNRYKILRIPDASEYPDVPAVTLLSLEEYKQLGTKHERRLHKIIKILTAAGKEYTTIRIPCYSVCTIEARTIKADGKIVNLPSKDLIRTERLTQYSSPFFLAQFAMPAVEAGDLVEYKSSSAT